MTAEPKGVLTGTHELSGSQACAEGALAAGCRFLCVYPIVPAKDVSERFFARAKEVGATFVQMEDEISALAVVLGASWTGKKSMTVTSGPGFSLMMEHVGLGVMLETPCVIIDIQRVGPSEGLPNSPSQGDIMQARWGSHGDYEVIALSPNSPQEMFNLTIKAFNLSEKYRTPVMIMSDAAVARMKEEVIIPPANQIKIEPRRYFKGPKEKYLPYKWEEDLVPPMVNIGEGYRFHVTGLTHNEKGYPVMSDECQELNVHRLVNKIRRNAEKIVEVEENKTDDAEIIVVSYGITSKVALKAVDQARKNGIKVGHLRLITVWPFPDKRISELAKRTRGFVVPEMNYGQIAFELERCSHGEANVAFVHCKGKEVDDLKNIFHAIRNLLTEKTGREEIIEYRNE
ncbi:2-oxoacid:acceptor oxidoreductase subunit alpha [candidate division KSB1 bacterium]|nr:MAG: 2-oxoacid:acceptor oxidoreductase subunit alpha [candidate division KSB1 bacterium]